MSLRIVGLSLALGLLAACRSQSAAQKTSGPANVAEESSKPARERLHRQRLPEPPAQAESSTPAQPNVAAEQKADPPAQAPQVAARRGAGREETPSPAKVGDLVRVREYHPNGQLATERTEFVLEGGKRVRQGPMKAWHENGQPYVEGGYDADGRLTGRWRYFDSTGLLLREGDYVEGLREGDWIEVWPNGQKHSQGFLHHGLLEGPWKYWWDNGHPLAEGEYINNLREGQWLFWAEDGTPDVGRSGIYHENVKIR